MLRIGEFSTLSQTSVKTLRYYAAVDLLRPVHVDPTSGYRYYSADQVTELGQILHLKMLGFSLREIRQVVRGNDSDRLLALLLEKRNAALGRIRDEELRLASLDGWLDRVGHGDLWSRHTVTLKRIGPQPIASIRRMVTRYSDAVELFAELAGYVKKHGCGVGPPAVIWHTCGESGDAIDCEAYVPVRSRATANHRVRVYELPATTWASVVHAGDSQSSIGAYRTARKWIDSHGFTVAGPKRELYWRGGLDNDRAGDLTEIQFAIAMSRSQVPST
jgi:DNA-binding transcriptional MerR regulator